MPHPSRSAPPAPPRDRPPSAHTRPRSGVQLHTPPPTPPAPGTPVPAERCCHSSAAPSSPRRPPWEGDRDPLWLCVRSLENPALDGSYRLVPGVWLHGDPLWQADPGLVLGGTSAGYWAIGACRTAGSALVSPRMQWALRSEQPHCGLPPHAISHWLRWEGHRWTPAPFVRITASAPVVDRYLSAALPSGPPALVDSLHRDVCCLRGTAPARERQPTLTELRAQCASEAGRTDSAYTNYRRSMYLHRYAPIHQREAAEERVPALGAPPPPAEEPSQQSGGEAAATAPEAVPRELPCDTRQPAAATARPPPAPPPRRECSGRPARAFRSAAAP
eukprot:TRINITY_DN12168_c0_g1_i1.p1 TRINITY_DN12168_c0_g1~~TRINITY_DN12168_c0_g1_i1.p1  ORF type:complete len:332 (+),score=37.13 TRINITY_DN12168_c0_g1_i1:74-1069(+)